MKITSKDLRKKWFDFWQSKGHSIIPSASLVPENDPSVLFTTAGMHPLVPFLLGEKHPAGKRIANVQKCVRTNDIDEVGNISHLTFFEMLGNWSLGDYFKDEMIPWSFEFLTGKNYLNLPLEKLAVTVFEGDETVQKDTTSAGIWEKCGMPKNRIYYLPKEDNWWGLGSGLGPCGPDTEMFYLVKPRCGVTCGPACKCKAYVEIWNDVFMEYNGKGEGKYEKLAKPNVDTGMGLERVLFILNGNSSVYETEIFEKALNQLEKISGKKYGANEQDSRSMRIVLEHIRAATFIIGDPVQTLPSNVGRGYILRRLLRRAILKARNLGIAKGQVSSLCGCFKDVFSGVYDEVFDKIDYIIKVVNDEEDKFFKTLTDGEKEFNKLIENLKKFAPENKKISGEKAFRLYDTYGFPLEVTEELAAEQGYTIDADGYKKAYELHQQKSQTATAGAFKGGLAEAGEQTTKLHTATHLLHNALSVVLSSECKQMGSNITSERLRFDFSYDRKITDEELKKIEDYVNEAIKKAIPVVTYETTVEDAKAKGAIGVFDSRYGNKVKVYEISGFGSEICGGPHAINTKDLGSFKIIKEEASSAGVRRIKAIIS